jgi:hypothetical protein
MPHNKLIEEKGLLRFLEALNANVFVTSRNSVTDEVENLNPTIEDQEAIIKISGEWDREDLKHILSDLLATRDSEMIEAVEEEVPEFSGKSEYSIGWNDARRRVLMFLRPQQQEEV